MPPSSPSPSLESPTGQVLFARQYPTSDGNTRWAFVSIDVATGEVLQAPGSLDVGPWSPDGSSILGSNQDGIVTVSVSAAAIVTVVTRTESRFSKASWSPDGRSILLDRITPDKSSPVEMLIARSDGGGDRLLARDVTAGRWSPDGRLVAAGSGLPGDYPQAIVLVDVASGATERLAEDAAFILGWAPDSEVLVYIGTGPQCTLCVVTLSSKTVKSLIPERAFLPDPSQIAVLGWRSAREMLLSYPREGIGSGSGAPVQVALVDVDAGTVTALLVVEGTTADRISLSPDGSTLVWARLDGPGNLPVIWVQPLTGEARQLSYPPAGGYDDFPSWQPAPAPVEWPAFDPAPDPTPTSHAATGHLEVSGARQASVDVAGTCSAREDGVGLYMERDGTVVQIGMTSGGTITFLEVFLDDFEAFAGKGFEARPPWVVAELGAGPTEGELTFHDLPNANGEGTINGQATWSCPDFQP